MVDNLKAKVPKTAGQLLASIGYSKATAKGIPGLIMESDGVQEELLRLGFTEDAAKRVVTQIMLDDEVDENARLKAADMTFKVHGSYAPEKSEHVIATTPLTQDQIDAIIRRRAQGISPSGPPQPDGLQHPAESEVPTELAPRGPGSEVGSGGEGADQAADSDDAAPPRQEPADDNQLPSVVPGPQL